MGLHDFAKEKAWAGKQAIWGMGEEEQEVKALNSSPEIPML